MQKMEAEFNARLAEKDAHIRCLLAQLQNRETALARTTGGTPHLSEHLMRSRSILWGTRLFLPLFKDFFGGGKMVRFCFKDFEGVVRW